MRVSSCEVQGRLQSIAVSGRSTARSLSRLPLVMNDSENSREKWVPTPSSRKTRRVPEWDFGSLHA